jgi:hypothetical protein
LRASEKTNAACRIEREVLRQRKGATEIRPIKYLPILIKFSLQLEAGYADAARMTDGKPLAAILPVDFSNPAGDSR